MSKPIANSVFTFSLDIDSYRLVCYWTHSKSISVIYTVSIYYICMQLFSYWCTVPITSIYYMLLYYITSFFKQWSWIINDHYYKIYSNLLLMFPLLKLFIDNHSSDCNIPRLIFLCYPGTPHQELPELSPKSMPSFPGNGPALLGPCSKRCGRRASSLEKCRLNGREIKWF